MKTMKKTLRHTISLEFKLLSDANPGRLCLKQFIHHFLDLRKRTHGGGQRVEIAGLVDFIAVAGKSAFHVQLLTAGTDVIQQGKLRRQRPHMNRFQSFLAREYRHFYATGFLDENIRHRLKLDPDIETFRKVFDYARLEFDGRGIDGKRFIWSLPGLFNKEESFDLLLSKAAVGNISPARGAPVLTAQDYDSDPW